MTHFTNTILATALVATAGVASAQDLSYVGLNYTALSGTDIPGGPQGDASAIGVEAAFVYNLNSSSRIAVEGVYAVYDGGNNQLITTQPGAAAEVSIHYLRDANDRLTYGAFIAYGVAEANENNPNEHYPHIAVGLQGVYAVNDRFTVYGQAAFVDNPDDTTNSGGYRDGHALRLGAVYTGFQNTSLFLEIEDGAAVGYESDSEDGDFRQIALGGETSFNGGPWAITYEVSHEFYDAVTDSEEIDAIAVSLGMRYYFGGNNGSDMRDAGFIGTPDIMSRSGTYVDTLN